MTRSIHRSAEDDLAGAFRYYKAEAGAGIAGRFLNEFERVARLLEFNSPQTSALRHAAPLTDRRL